MVLEEGEGVDCECVTGHDKNFWLETLLRGNLIGSDVLVARPTHLPLDAPLLLNARDCGEVQHSSIISVLLELRCVCDDTERRHISWKKQQSASLGLQHF